MSAEDVRARLRALSGPRRELLHRQLLSAASGAARPAPAQPATRPAVAPERASRFSLFFFSSDASPANPRKYDLLLECVERAEREGLHAVWTPERHFVDFGSLFPNPAVLGAALAARTSRVGIRGGSVVAPLHDCVRIVEDWSVVDNLSAGRVGLSLASGWHPDDFVLAPDAYEDRARRTADAVATLRSLWGGGPLRRKNGLGEMVEVRPRPAPLQRDLPLWLTVVRARGFAHAARLGVGVLTGLMELEIDELARLAGEYRAQFVGPAAPWVTVTVHTHVRPEPSLAAARAALPLKRYLRSFLTSSVRSLRAQPEASTEVAGLSASEEDAILTRITERYLTSRSLIGTPGECARTVARLSDAGVDEIACLVDFGLPDDEVLEGLDHLMRVRDQARCAA